MAFIDTFAKYHTLSKYPVDENTSLANVRNKSGHTVTTSDIWASEIPAFFVVYDDDTRNSLAATEGDLCKQGSTLYEYKNGAWSVRNALTDGEVIGGIIKYHKGCKAVILTDTNNSGTGGNGYSVRIRPNSDTSGTGPFISSFISSMDKVVNGIPSVGYDPVIHDTTSSTGFRGEGTGTNDYIANCYGGVITFNTKRDQVDSQGNPIGNNAEITITIDCFEYIGEKLNTSITELAKKVESVTATAGEGVQAVTDAATTAGLSVSTKEITVEGESDSVTVKALDIAVADVSTQGVIASGDDDKLVTATGAQNIAKKASSDAITAATLTTPSGSSDAIADTTYTSKLVTAEQVKTYVTNNAQVTVKVGTTEQATTNLELAGSTGNDVTITATADTSNGYKVTFGASIDKATVTSGVIDTTTGNGDKVISATNAKSVAEKAIDLAVADNGVIDNRIDTLITNATSTTDIVDNDTSKKLVTAEQVATYVASEVGAIDTGVTSISVNNSEAKKGAVSITALEGVETASRTGVSDESIKITNESNKVKLTVLSAGAQVSEDTLSYSRYSDYLATAADADVIATFRAEKAKKALADTAITGNSLSVKGSGVSVTLGGKVGAPTLTGSVTPATYTSSTKTWTNDSYFAKASDVKTAISDAVGAITIPVVTTSTAAQGVGVTANGHEVSVATADYTTPTQGSGWTTETKGYLVTGSTVETFVNDVVSEVSSNLSALENKVNAYHEAGVSYKIHDSQTLPDLAVAENVENYKNVILLVPTVNGSDPSSDENAAITGGYVEWLCVNKGTKEAPSWAWEQIGTTEADLHGYVNAIGGNTIQGNHTSPVYASISSTGYLTLGVDSATASVMGVSKLYTGNYYSMASLADKSNTAVSLSTVSDMFTGITDAKADKISVVLSINDKQGDISIRTHNGLSNVPQGEVLSDSQFSTGSVLWGTAVTTDNGKPINIIDGFVGLDGSARGYLQLAALPSDAVSVENNFVYNASGKVITSIRPERMISGFRANSATGLKSFVGDLSNLKTANYGETDAFDNKTFYNSSALETFIGDLSSLTDGKYMFNGCTALTSFCGDLSSLTDGTRMFYGCNLDAESLECIADTLPTVTSGTIEIGASTNATDEVIATIKGKGWTLKSNETTL